MSSLKSELQFVAAAVTSVIFLVFGKALLGDLSSPDLDRRNFPLALRRHALVIVRRRAPCRLSRGPSRRAARHADPDRVGHHDRSHHDLGRHADRREQSGPRARHHVRRHHGRPERNGRARDSSRRPEAQRTDIQPPGCEHLHRHPDSALGAHPRRAELHAEGSRRGIPGPVLGVLLLVVCVVLYLVFLGIQTMRYRHYFVQPGEEGEAGT